MPFVLINGKSTRGHSFEVDPADVQERELLARSRYRFGAYNMHPIGAEDKIAIRPGSVLWRGTTSNYLSQRGVESIGISAEFHEPRVYMSESTNDAAGYAYIQKDGGGLDYRTKPGGKPIVVKIKVDRELLGLLKPGFEGGGEWYYPGPFLPRKFVTQVLELPRKQEDWNEAETISYYASLPEYHDKWRRRPLASELEEVGLPTSDPFELAMEDIEDLSCPEVETFIQETTRAIDKFTALAAKGKKGNVSVTVVKGSNLNIEVEDALDVLHNVKTYAMLVFMKKCSRPWTDQFKFKTGSFR